MERISTIFDSQTGASSTYVIMPSQVPITTHVNPRIDSEWKFLCPFPLVLCSAYLRRCRVTNIQLLLLAQAAHVRAILVVAGFGGEHEVMLAIRRGVSLEILRRLAVFHDRDLFGAGHCAG